MGIIQEAYEYVENRFVNSKIKLPYHNWKHTHGVYDVVRDFINEIPEFNEEQSKYLKLAALFHDIGYLETFHEHEARGAEIATEFLNEHNEDNKCINEVARVIKATKLNHTPTDLLERVIVDADMSHLGSESYFDTAFKDLRLEIKQCSDQEFSDKGWIQNCYDFLSSHEYLTPYAKKKYHTIKEKNINKLSEKLKEIKEKKKAKKKMNKSKDKEEKNPLKGVETMFKIALRNHVDLSAIADKKANTLISVNAIIISIVLSALFPKLDSNPFLFYPSVTILVGSFFTIILAILSTIPKITHGHISKRDVQDKKGNLLFFGNFHEMKLEDYLWGVERLMESKEYIYSSMTRDLYFLGKVLNRKYILLRWSYYIFMLGLLLSILIFVFKIIPYLGTNTEVQFEGIGLF